MIKKFYLVYQAGIANVFERVTWTNGEGATSRVLQSDFRTCEIFCRGIRSMGGYVIPAWCNEAGDITNRQWNYDEFFLAPFDDKFAPDFVGEND